MFMHVESTPPQSPRQTIEQIKRSREVEFNFINRLPENTPDLAMHKQQAFLAFSETESNIILRHYGIPTQMTDNGIPRFRRIPETALYFAAKDCIYRLENNIHPDLLNDFQAMDIDDGDQESKGARP